MAFEHDFFVLLEKTSDRKLLRSEVSHEHDVLERACFLGDVSDHGRQRFLVGRDKSAQIKAAFW